MESSTIYQVLILSAITSELFVLEQKKKKDTAIAFLSLQYQSIDTHLKKCQNVTSTLFVVTGLVRSKLVILGSISFEAKSQTLWYTISVVHHLWFKDYGQKSNLPILL